LTEASTLVGLAGTVTTLAGIALDLPAYDSQAIHHSTLTRADVDTLTTRFLTSTHTDRASIPVMHPGRVDVITSGTLILRAIMRRTGAEQLVVSEHDILDGIAWSVAGE
ncbi:exopolyphosphatase, partial [Streptomyces sp. SID11233]|nr:exopolyphosphatase [Streptomyces sp. SID11233]